MENEQLKQIKKLSAHINILDYSIILLDNEIADLIEDQDQDLDQDLDQDQFYL